MPQKNDRSRAARRRCTRAGKESQRDWHNYGALINSLDGIVWEADVESFRFTFVSEQAERILGYPLERWLEEPTFWQDHIHVDDRDWAVDFCLKASAEKRPYEFEYRMVASDGNVVWLRDIVTVSVKNNRAAQLRGVMVDITRQKQYEAQLKESQRQYQDLVDSLDGIIWEADARTFKFTFVSKQCERLLGYSPEHWLARLTWQDLIHPEDIKDVFATCAKAVEEKRNHSLEYRMLAADGRVVWIRDIATVVLENGLPTKLRGVLLNVSESKRNEEALRQKTQQLRQSQKMETIGKLAGGIAHDFNNILSVIQGYASLFQGQTNLPPGLVDASRQIGMAAGRAANLTRQLLTFSRQQPMQFQNLDLNIVVTNMTRMLERILGEDISLRVHAAPTLQLVRADIGMMEQVLLNLVVNAREAMPRGGRLVIRTSLVTTGADDAERNPEASAGKFVRLKVSDNGCGISPANLPRILEPFFTTKDVGKGTGLGLATVYGIVKQHQGWIKVASRLGRGTTFQIFLRATREKSTGFRGSKHKVWHPGILTVAPRKRHHHCRREPSQR